MVQMQHAFSKNYPRCDFSRAEMQDVLLRVYNASGTGYND